MKTQFVCLLIILALCMICSCKHPDYDRHVAVSNIDQITKSLTPKTWEDGNVFYMFDDEISDDHKNKVRDVFTQIEQNTKCIYFIEIDPGEYPDYVFIKYSYEDVSWGTLGFSKNSQIKLQKTRFDSPSGARMIYHETFHVLGLIHEHQRPDRDAHILINWDNIQKNRPQYFKIKNNFLYNLEEHCYDAKSVMHYPSYAFSKNALPTISFKRLTDIFTGHGNTPPKSDYQKIIAIYGG